MEDETIQKDVSAEDQVTGSAAEAQAETASTPAGEAPLSRRERKMAEVNAKRIEEREQQRKKAALINDPDLTEEEYDAQQVAPEGTSDNTSQLESSGEDGDEGSFEAEEQPPVAEEQSADDRQSADAVPAGWERRDDGVLVKRLKVNGEERVLTSEEYDRLAQKVLSGDERLRRAAEQERVLQQREEELNRRSQQASQPPEVSDADVDAAFDGFLGAVYEGDQDVAKERLKAILQGRQSSTPNMDELVNQATTRVAQNLEEKRRQESQVQGWNKFQAEYPDIASTPEYLAAADVIVGRLASDNPDWMPEQVYLEAGRLASEKLNLGGRKPEKTDDKRMERKSQLKPVPRAGSATHKPATEPQVDMSPAAKIARMRTSRAL
jgi:hypothetical protein